MLFLNEGYRFMSRPRLAYCLVLAVFSSTSVADAQLSKLQQNDFSSATMNFANITSTNLVQTDNETVDHEKEVAVGDIDQDGDLDVVVISARSFTQPRRNALYLNNGGVLEENSQLVSANGTDWRFFTNLARNALLKDFDADGWLDLIVISDSLGGIATGTTRYYRNQHPGGVFTGFVEDTSRLGGSNGAACGGVSGDFDHDGDEDYWFGNYPGPSQDTMEFNNGTGNFNRASSNMVPSDTAYTVDVATGDINGDGKTDMFVSNEGEASLIYYNDLNDAGSQVGDFRYAGSTEVIHPGNNLYPAMEPGDFNGDGRLDIYFANFGTGANAGKDSILVNNGNDASGKATFVEFVMPDFVSDNETAKVTVSDLNGDGRVDLLVMGGSQHFSSQRRRPVIYRNTSVNGQTSFVEWTPAPAFPSGTAQSGWFASAFDADGDQRKEIFVGGMRNDFLIKSVPTRVWQGPRPGGVLPAVHNQEPLAVIGTLTMGEQLDFTSSIPAGATVSAVLNSTAGVTLEILNGGSLVASSNRGGLGVEEAVEFEAPGGTLTFRVILDESTAAPRNPLGLPYTAHQGDRYQLEVLSRSN